MSCARWEWPERCIGGQGGWRDARSPDERGTRVGGVMGDQVEDCAEAAGVEGVEQTNKIGESAEDGVDRGVVGDVVAEVGHGGGVEGGDPGCVDAEGGQVVDAGEDAGEI